MMTPPPVFTAIEFNPSEDDDVRSTITQPLLGEDEEHEGHVAQAPKASGKFLGLGILIGFLVQIISLGSYAFMLSQYDENFDSDVEDKERKNWFMYSVLSFLTQVDLVIYILIWVAFSCTMTSHGLEFIRGQCRAPIQRRSIFVIGVYFLVGIVLGAFVAWTTIDFYLGFPIPFVPIAVTVAIDLVLCYMMVFCYDLGKEGKDQEVDDMATC